MQDFGTCNVQIKIGLLIIDAEMIVAIAISSYVKRSFNYKCMSLALNIISFNFLFSYMCLCKIYILLGKIAQE